MDFVSSLFAFCRTTCKFGFEFEINLIFIFAKAKDISLMKGYNEYL